MVANFTLNVFERTLELTPVRVYHEDGDSLALVPTHYLTRFLAATPGAVTLDNESLAQATADDMSFFKAVPENP